MAPNSGHSGSSEGAGTGGAGGSRVTAGSGANAGAAAGSGGESGASGSPPPIAGTGSALPAAESCSENGSTRCSPGQQIEQCVDGDWSKGAVCGEGEVCSLGALNVATCAAVAAVCRGSAGAAVCDDSGVMYDCGADGVPLSQHACASPTLCQKGLDQRKCLNCVPGDFKCDDAKLTRCGTDGQAFEDLKTCANAALCNPDAGECTAVKCQPGMFSCSSDRLSKCNADQTGFADPVACKPGLCDAKAGQCDVCVPGAKSCGGTMSMTCDAQGQKLVGTLCTAPKNKCVGNGQCVECAVDADCADPGACKTRHCNLATGACEPSPAAVRSSCNGGLCNGSGSCAACLADDDCGDPGVCKSKHCDAASQTCKPQLVASGVACTGSNKCDGAGACVACVRPSDCDGSACVTAGCSAGACTKTNKARGTSCDESSGRVCNGSGTCVGCNVDTDCTGVVSTGACTEAACMSGSCGTRPKMPGTGCGSMMVCTDTGACMNSCGNRVFDPGVEECDASATNNWECNRNTCKSTGLGSTAYSKNCSSDADCTGSEVCDTTWFGQGICMAPCVSSACQVPPGYSGMCSGASQGCLIKCSATADCPPGITCQNTLCLLASS